VALARHDGRTSDSLGQQHRSDLIQRRVFADVITFRVITSLTGIIGFGAV